MNDKEKEAKKPEMLEHQLCYEIAMLESTFLRLSDPKLDQVLCNALIESFGMHARNLIDFFCSTEAKYNDAIAKDFTNKEYKNGSKDGNPEYDKLSKQFMHLSYQRTKNSAEKLTYPDDLKKLKRQIDVEIENFERHLKNEYKKHFIKIRPIKKSDRKKLIDIFRNLSPAATTGNAPTTIANVIRSSTNPFGTW